MKQAKGTIYSFPKQKGTILQLQLWWPDQLHPTRGASLVLYPDHYHALFCALNPDVPYPVISAPEISNPSTPTGASPEPEARQVPMPTANKDWRQSSHHHPGALVCNSTVTPIQSRASPHHHPCPSQRLQQDTLVLGNVILQSLHGLIPEIAAPQTQPAKGELLGCQQSFVAKSSKPSARIRDRLCCIFSQGKQSLRKSLNTGAPKTG